MTQSHGSCTMTQVAIPWPGWQSHDHSGGAPLKEWTMPWTGKGNKVTHREDKKSKELMKDYFNSFKRMRCPGLQTLWSGHWFVKQTVGTNEWTVQATYTSTLNKSWHHNTTPEITALSCDAVGYVGDQSRVWQTPSTYLRISFTSDFWAMKAGRTTFGSTSW